MCLEEARQGSGSGKLQPGLLELCALKGARTVPGGRGDGDTSSLPDKLGRDVALATAGRGSGIRGAPDLPRRTIPLGVEITKKSQKNHKKIHCNHVYIILYP